MYSAIIVLERGRISLQRGFSSRHARASLRSQPAARTTEERDAQPSDIGHMPPDQLLKAQSEAAYPSARRPPTRCACAGSYFTEKRRAVAKVRDTVRMSKDDER